nr:molecular chaperone [Brevibacillus dissolubilis]
MDRSNRQTNTYTREELSEMTTFQLRTICYKEKLVKGLANTLDREGLIRTILQFRNAEDTLLIQSHVADGFARVEAALHTYAKTPLSDSGHIKIPARITLYEGLGINKLDRYRVETGNEVGESNILIVNDHFELCGILNLMEDPSEPGVYYLQMEPGMELVRTSNKHYHFLFFKKQDSEYLYRAYHQDRPLPPAVLRYYRIPVADLEIRTLETTEAVLAIDFGTSNTTAGAFLDSNYISTPPSHDLLNGKIRLNQINFVTFPNRGQREEEWIELLPTVVSVTDCSDPENIRYTYGFEAQKHMKKSGYSSHVSVFHGLKRWVNSYEKTEELVDPHGRIAHVKRKDILRAYLLHVIQTAEHQFKCCFKNLHITSPVKLKNQFAEMFAGILPEYQIESGVSLDEGLAVLYNTIANQIERNQFLDGEEYKALVIDCGGGTTDLSSCRFRIEDGQITYKIDIHTTYENGDTNFGGNNITYKIMQFMKIAFANYYTRSKRMADIDSLIDIPGTDLFRHVDEFGIDAVYEKFESAYREAEAVIPTRYREFENRTRDEYQRAKNNFYFLWEIAEEMKKEFFRKTGILRNRFQSEGEHQEEHDLRIMAVERWSLSIMEDGRFRDVHDFPDVVFTIKEINHLIKADIYEIIRKFLESFYEEGRLSDYSIIKLTGQSCRIDVFREALKEFVPGRSIEFRQKSEDTGKVAELKLSCLRGAIRFLHAQKAGFIEASITNHAPIVPYSVSAYTHSRQEKVLIASHERLVQFQGYISRPVTVSEIEFFLRGIEGNVRHKFIYTNRHDQYEPVVYEEIADRFHGKIPQDDIDAVGNGEVKFCVFADENNWGFHVVPIARQHEQLYLGRKQFFAFENDLSELDFFDGMK